MENARGLGVGLPTTRQGWRFWEKMVGGSLTTRKVRVRKGRRVRVRKTGSEILPRR